MPAFDAIGSVPFTEMYLASQADGGHCDRTARVEHGDGEADDIIHG